MPPASKDSSKELARFMKNVHISNFKTSKMLLDKF